MMTQQEVFDRVVTHLIEQGEACTASTGATCLYRNRKGQKCAAGALIKDEFYSEDLETNLSTELIVVRALVASGVNEDDLDLVHQLQTVHDETEPDQWEDELSGVADYFDLDYPEVLK